MRALAEEPGRLPGSLTCLHAHVRRLRHRELSSLELRVLDYKVSDGQSQDQKVERTLEASAACMARPLVGKCAAWRCRPLGAEAHSKGVSAGPVRAVGGEPDEPAGRVAAVRPLRGCSVLAAAALPCQEPAQPVQSAQPADAGLVRGQQAGPAGREPAAAGRRRGDSGRLVPALLPVGQHGPLELEHLPVPALAGGPARAPPHPVPHPVRTAGRSCRRQPPAPTESSSSGRRCAGWWCC